MSVDGMPWIADIYDNASGVLLAKGQFDHKPVEGAYLSVDANSSTVQFPAIGLATPCGPMRMFQNVAGQAR